MIPALRIALIAIVVQMVIIVALFEWVKYLDLRVIILETAAQDRGWTLVKP